MINLEFKKYLQPTDLIREYHTLRQNLINTTPLSRSYVNKLESFNRDYTNEVSNEYCLQKCYVDENKPNCLSNCSKIYKDTTHMSGLASSKVTELIIAHNNVGSNFFMQ
jgi:hypothetical protein